MKYTNIVSYRIGKKTIVFDGREPASCDAELLKNLLIAGVAKKTDDGKVFYSGAASVKLKDDTEIQVPDNGLVDVKMEDIKNTEVFESQESK